MKRLIERGLMFGNLIPVRSSALVDRYNRALKHLTGKTTKLKDFHVDISGYSPEIGAEQDDPLYLNHAGVNRQFILLTTDQKRAPLLEAKFSTSRDILKQFIETNEAQLFALTAQDAVAGELLNSVFDVTDPARLLDIQTITVEADTTGETVAKATELAARIEEFKSHPDAWYDDVLIAKMIGLAKHTGDVTRNPVRLNQVSFSQASYWTEHFGGLFLFRDVEHPAAIVCETDALGAFPVAYMFDLDARGHIAKFLQLNNLVEPIVRVRGVDGAAILQQKMDFIVVDLAASKGAVLAKADRRGLRTLARSFSADLPPEYHGLAGVHRWAVNGGKWPKMTSDHPAYFYTLRAKAGLHASLVNRLLAQLTQKDARQLFICHKELFYQVYHGWSDAKKTYVADFLEREYQVDKAGARKALFGNDAPMEDVVDDADNMIHRVGPWGAVGRR